MVGLVKRLRKVRGWRASKALRAATALDRLVDAQLPLLPGLGDDARRRRADHLAELVMLAQSYRQYAYGWIGRRELDRRGRRAVTRLGGRSSLPPKQTSVFGAAEPD